MSLNGLYKSLTAAVLFLMHMTSHAQGSDLLDRFYASVSDSCLNMTYSYSARVSGIDNIGQGTLLSQGTMWTLRGNGVEMYCDSKSIWVVDPSMKEVVVEPAPEDEQTQWMSNPAVIFSLILL